ncbi:MAG: hypothetical protein HZA60_05090 [Deltaproteobacteria bacterium]|nr:hypothetical protein [Deltaproteobacteria bacterium]
MIDVGFFLPLYKDEVRTPMINLAMRLISTLKAAGVESDSIWLVRRNGDFEFPLEFGYLPGLLQETFTNPERFSNSLPEKWKRLDAAQYLAFFGQVEEALREYEDLMRLEDAPFLLYEGAILKFKYGDLDAGIKYLRGAAIKDRDYSRGFLLQALYFWRKGELAATESILRAGRDLFPDDEMMSIGLARVLTEQALSEREADPLGAKSRVDEALSLAIPEEIRKEITHVWGRGVPPGEK